MLIFILESAHISREGDQKLVGGREEVWPGSVPLLWSDPGHFLHAGRSYYFSSLQLNIWMINNCSIPTMTQTKKVNNLCGSRGGENCHIGNPMKHADGAYKTRLMCLCLACNSTAMQKPLQRTETLLLDMGQAFTLISMDQ